MSSIPYLSNAMHSRNHRAKIEQEMTGARPVGVSLPTALQTETPRLSQLPQQIQIETNLFRIEGTTTSNLMQSVQSLFSRH